MSRYYNEKEGRRMVMRIMKKLLVCVLTLIIVVTAVPVKTVQAASGTNKTSSEK